jgi:hypothetical protein
VSTITPGKILRDGTFLWQLDSPSGSGMNLWSGRLEKNNGYPLEHALRAAVLLEAAHDLLEALKGVVRVADRNTDEFAAAHAAIAKAEGNS